VPLLRQPHKPRWKPAAFSHYPRPAQPAPAQSSDSILKQGVMGYTMRTESWRYTEWRQGNRTLEAELYDHRQDPHETLNLASDPARKDSLLEMNKLINAGWQGARHAL